MQTQGVVDQIGQRLSGIAADYNRLVLLVGPSGNGRTDGVSEFNVDGFFFAERFIMQVVLARCRHRS